MISNGLAFLAGIAVAVPLFHVSAAQVKEGLSSLKTRAADVFNRLRGKKP